MVARASPVPTPHSAVIGRWRYLFLVKGWFNILGSVGFIAIAAVSEPFRVWTGTDTPAALMYLHVFLAHAIFFGLAYVWIARDPLRHVGIIYLSLPIEVADVIIALGNWAAGTVDLVLAVFLLQDGVAAAFFIAFLLRYRHARP